MPDVHTPEIRSYNMSRIRNKDTKPEKLVRSALHRYGFRFRLNYKKLPGKPDIILKKFKSIIFVHGCFWHGHKNCKYYTTPKTRQEWWLNKINKNRYNDQKNKKLLKKDGWSVIEIYECQLKNRKLINTINKAVRKIKKNVSLY